MPALVLMTDDERLADPLPAARALPRGSMIIIRARQSHHRAKLAHLLRPIVRVRGLILLIAGDAGLAGRVAADGLHLPEATARQAYHWRARRPRWIITAAAHSLAACASAKRYRTDAVLLSPLFATASHPGTKDLGAARARLIARQAAIPIYALGGIDAANAAHLWDSRFIGLVAVAALAA